MSTHKHTFWLSYSVTVFLASALCSLLAWVLAPVFFAQGYKAIVPVPSFLSLLSNKQVSSLDLWLPSLRADEPIKPLIAAKSALLYDLSTQKTLYALAPIHRLPMASLTKIMTAIIALENPKLGDQYVVPKEALVGEDSMGLNSGEILSQEDLLYGLLLPSGNDAAEVFAYNYPGGRTAFIQAMNDKAQSLGLKNTHFTNPSGLQGDGEQYTTVYDLVVMTRYALEHFPKFAAIVATTEHSIPQTKAHKTFYLTNETNLLTTYPGVKGVKTGYTPEAELCLVTYLEYKGHKIIGVLLGSNNRRKEMKDLLDYSLTSLGISPPKYGGF